MKYVSIDIETTGLDPDGCQILSIGAVIEDTNNILPIEECPTFHVAIKRHNISGNLFAINMNKELLENISKYASSSTEDEKDEISKASGLSFIEEGEVSKEFWYFLYENGMVDAGYSQTGGYIEIRNGESYPAITNKTKPTHVNVAGKNFGTFDKLFLEKLPRWKQLIKFRNRIIDPSVYYTDWKSDESLPGLGDCKKRNGGFESSVVAHDAVEDARDVILLMRKFYS